MNLKLFFFFFLLIQDFSFTIAYIFLKCYKHVDIIHTEGTTSQIFDLGLTF